MNAPNTASIPPQAIVMQMTYGVAVAKTLQVAAELRIADALAGGAKTPAEIAAATGADADVVRRMLRALSMLGVFRREEGDRWANTPVSDVLRADVPGSVRDFVMMHPHDGNVAAWTRFGEVARSGRSSFEEANGADYWGYLDARPALAARFHGAMAGLTARLAAAAATSIDFGRFASILDIGGGDGELLSAILRAATRARGAILETAAGAAVAARRVRERGLDARIEVVAGDMFAAVPPGHDAHLLKHVLHNWNDAQAGVLLRRSRDALAPGGRLFVFESIVPEGPEPHLAKLTDLHMLVTLGGKERTERDWRALLDEAGYRLERVTPLLGQAVIEAAPR